MKTFRNIVELEELKNAKISYSLKGAKITKDEFIWTIHKQKILVKDIIKRKKVNAYRTFSLCEKEWFKQFDNGYTETGNINTEKGLTSFTLDKQMMNRFSGSNTQTIRLEIIMKEYAEILDDSAYPEEKEILGYDVKWKVTGIDESYRDWYIYGEQI
jgi:hypothetical protein